MHLTIAIKVMSVAWIAFTVAVWPAIANQDANDSRSVTQELVQAQERLRTLNTAKQQIPDGLSGSVFFVAVRGSLVLLDDKSVDPAVYAESIDALLKEMRNTKPSQEAAAAFSFAMRMRNIVSARRVWQDRQQGELSDLLTEQAEKLASRLPTKKEWAIYLAAYIEHSNGKIAEYAKKQKFTPEEMLSGEWLWEHTTPEEINAYITNAAALTWMPKRVANIQTEDVVLMQILRTYDEANAFTEFTRVIANAPEYPKSDKEFDRVMNKIGVDDGQRRLAVCGKDAHHYRNTYNYAKLATTVDENRWHALMAMLQFPIADRLDLIQGINKITLNQLSAHTEVGSLLVK